MLTRISLAGIVALAVSFGPQATAQAASYEHIDTLALQLQAQSGKLYREFRLHYRHTPQYRHLISDARSLAARSRHIHELAHHHGSIQHLANDLRQLDHSFHHVEQLLHHIELAADYGHQGHVHGATGHVHLLMKQMEATLHHLRADIAALTPHHTIGHGHGIHQVIRTVQTPQVRSHSGIRSGWKYGLNDLHRKRGRISLRFN